MPRNKRAVSVKNRTKKRPVATTSASRSKSSRQKSGFMDKVNQDLGKNRSALNIFLGVVIILLLGFLVYSFFIKPNQPQITGELGPAQHSASPSQTVSKNGDVNKNSLPGNYTVKDNDTLFDIAQRYYNNGYEFTKIAAANKLADADVITVGQVLTIPKENDPAYANILPAPTPPTADNSQQNLTASANYGTGGPTNQTIWGERITGDTYTIQPGDWLSKIAGRAYGDISLYTKIAQANNIPNPDLIQPGMVLKIPRA